MRRGEVWWASLPNPTGSVPGFRRPLVIVQSNDFNRSRINTIIAIVVTSNLKLARAPENILLSAKSTGLPRNSVANVSQIITVDKSFLTVKVGKLTSKQMQQLEEGLRLVLSL
ncbi:MAG: YdcE protein, chain A [Candidatus Scalindua rubra]|uniref:mRNA interferase n=1 Tax=Candidatus Scalindua rubra TaxID=1872076 RepID=A0A1E3X403_9BACT|nr:MAG: YdcE protein, chain A [Candidatus Scalindua rubra]